MTRFLSLLRGQGIAILALVVALGGTSYAAVKLPRNSVGALQLKPGAVTGPDVKDSSLTGADVRNETLTGADVKESTLRGVDATTLGGLPASAVGGTGRTGPSFSCDDDTHAPSGVECGEFTITLRRPGRLLVMVGGYAMSDFLDDASGTGAGIDSTTSASGSCQVVLDGVGLFTSFVSTRAAATTVAFSSQQVTDVVGRGVHTILTRCYESDGAMVFYPKVTAVTLGSD